MATLTLDVPDTVAQTVAQLSESDRAAYLAQMNALAVANLPSDEVEDADDLPDDVFLPHPLPTLLTEPLADDLRAARADVDAGRIIKGDTALAELRRYVGRK